MLPAWHTQRLRAAHSPPAFVGREVRPQEKGALSSSFSPKMALPSLGFPGTTFPGMMLPLKHIAAALFLLLPPLCLALSYHPGLSHFPISLLPFASTITLCPHTSQPPLPFVGSPGHGDDSSAVRASDTRWQHQAPPGATQVPFQ